MAFIACPGVAQVVLQVVNGEGDIGENVLNVYKGSTSAWTATELTNLANGIDTWSTTGDGAGHNYVSNLRTTCTLQAIVCRDLTSQTGPEVTKSVAHVGSDAGTPLPDGISKAFTLRTGLVGRSQRGRVFALFLTVNAQDGTDKNKMLAGTLASYVTMWGSLITAVPAITAAWQWVVLSKFSGVNGTTGKPIPRSSGQVTPISSVGYSHVYLDYQRRRAPAHARHH